MSDLFTPSASQPCPRCHGRGVVLIDLRSLGLGPGGNAFLAAGMKPIYDDCGGCRHEIVCPVCNGDKMIPGDLMIEP